MKALNENLQNIISAGDLELNRGCYADAVELFRSGIDLLGDDYRGGSSIDSTDNRVMLANIAVGRGNFREAAHLLRNALAARAAMYVRLSDA